MPLYEYKCDRCGKTFEVRQKFADEPLTVHEGCGGEVERLISAPSLQFKGTGWYITDYGRNHNSPSGNGKSDSKDSKKESKSETKSEKKTESKSESKPSTPAADK
jgi:putative FmdB family regulatory protein